MFVSSESGMWRAVSQQPATANLRTPTMPSHEREEDRYGCAGALPLARMQ
jgi:hypothetical protein